MSTMNFHSKANQYSYSDRRVDEKWREVISELLKGRHISHAVDIGCGGGLYLSEFVKMGAKDVTGVDYSSNMIEAAREHFEGNIHVHFQVGEAHKTGLSSGKYDLLLGRAVIHHLRELTTFFTEAHRLLDKKGVIIIQDRTLSDCFLEGSNEHIRGYLFELFPHLREIEEKRRYEEEEVRQVLHQVGFEDIETMKLWEMRRSYVSKEELLNDIGKRRGKSILHELTDEQLDDLKGYIDNKVNDTEVINETDRWTIWKAIKN